MEGEIKAIDYLVKNSGCDLCGKRAYYTQVKKEEDYTPCRAFEKDGTFTNYRVYGNKKRNLIIYKEQL